MPGEFEIISRIRALARPDDRVRAGIGDDAAVIAGAESDLLVTTDLFVEDVHFRRAWTTPGLIGHKALAAALSDVAAMGGTARFSAISIGLPAATSQDFIDGIFGGIFDLAGSFRVSVIGGDISASPDPLFIDAVVLGECPPGQSILRSGAKAGDHIYVTGTLGGASMGLKLLEDGFRLDDQAREVAEVAKTVMRREAILRHLKPKPRLEFGKMLREARVASAMIDVSDGLTADLSHIIEESQCGARIHANAIPIADYVLGLSSQLQLDPLQFALSGGEDYELLFTVPADGRSGLSDLSSKSGIEVTPLGEIVAEKTLLLERDGTAVAISPHGYEHKI